MKPVICFITDRQRIGSDDVVVQRVAAAARAGVHLVQIRERDLDGGPLTSLVGRCVEAVRATPARIIVNERIDVALAAGAHGVHLRSDSMPAARARHLTPNGFLIGRSVHSRDDAQRAAADDGVDYLLFGTVFETASKPGRVAGVAALADVVGATTVPVLAVGGITAERARAVAESGAAGVAAIGLFTDASMETLPQTVAALHMAFDTPARLP